jgi:hypothetical protein
MKIGLLCFTLLLFQSVLSQEWVGEDRDDLTRKFPEKNPNASLTQSTDSTMIFNLNVDSEEETTITFYFTKKDEVGMEETKSRCRQCLEMRLAAVLAKEKYRWRKINGNQYISRFSWKLLLEVEPESGNSFRIIRTGWTRKSYRLLTR